MPSPGWCKRQNGHLLLTNRAGILDQKPHLLVNMGIESATEAIPFVAFFAAICARRPVLSGWLGSDGSDVRRVCVCVCVCVCVTVHMCSLAGFGAAGYLLRPGKGPFAFFLAFEPALEPPVPGLSFRGGASGMTWPHLGQTTAWLSDFVHTYLRHHTQTEQREAGVTTGFVHTRRAAFYRFTPQPQWNLAGRQFCMSCPLLALDGLCNPSHAHD